MKKSLKNFFKSVVRAFGELHNSAFPACNAERGFAALTGTKVADTEYGGDYKTLIRTVVPSSASDTLTLVRATDKVSEIVGVQAQIETGQDADLQSVHCTFSGLVITIKTKNGAGVDATDWTNATIRLFITAR